MGSTSPHHLPDPTGFETTLQAARHGDLHALNRLVLAHQDAVYILAYRLLGDEAAAAEATQAAFVRAQRELRGYREGTFRVWVLRWLAPACRPSLGRPSARPGARRAAALPGCLAALPPACAQYWPWWTSPAWIMRSPPPCLACRRPRCSGIWPKRGGPSAPRWRAND